MFFALYKRKKEFGFTLLFVLLIFIDQFSKKYFLSKNIIFFCNKNISLDVYVYPAIFWLIWLFLIASLAYVWYKKPFLKTKLNPIYWIAIFSGAFSNSLDRLFIGCVRDFIPFVFSLFLFNMADVLISLGVLGILYPIISNKKISRST